MSSSRLMASADKAEASGFWHDRSVTIALGALCLLCAGHALYNLHRGLTSPVLESQYFRETQTALDVFWLWRGGPWFAYWTPIFGAPWSIPFELPIYQMIVALLRWAGVPIPMAGRLVAFGFFLACLWPLWILNRTLRFPPRTFLTVSAVILASPVYLYWGRTVLIETCAVFFGLLWLALVVAYLDRPQVLVALSAFGAGSLGVLAKSTTFPAFAIVGGLLILADIYRRRRELADRWRVFSLALLVLMGPFIVGSAWVVFTDAVKRRSVLGALITSDKLVAFHFGSMAQRFDLTLWRDIVLMRSIPEMFGYGGAIACAALGGLLLSRRHAIAAAGAAFGFLTPLLVFTNLHMVHNYYIAANALLALVAVGLALAAIMQSGHRVIGLAMLVAMIAGQLYYFHGYYAPWFAGDHSRLRTYRVGLLVREQTAPDDGIIVLGIDWSSEIAYYSERRSVTVPAWLPADLKRRLFAEPQSFLGQARFGAVVTCPWPVTDAIEQAFLADRRELASVDGCRVLAAERLTGAVPRAELAKR